MQKLLDEIDQVKIDIRTYEEETIDDDDDDDESQTEIRNFNERIINLQKQMNAMTKELDPDWPVETFDQVKQNALKILFNLSERLNRINQHLEETTYITPRPFVPSTTDENIKGVPSADNKRITTSNTTTAKQISSSSSSSSSESSDAETISDEEQSEENLVVVTDRKQEQLSSSNAVRNIENSTFSDEIDSEKEEDDQYMNDNPQEKIKFDNKNGVINPKHQSRTSTPLWSNKNPPSIDLRSSSFSSSSSSAVIASGNSASSISSDRHKTRTSKQPAKQNHTTDDYSSTDEEDLSSRVDTSLQKLRIKRYPPGTPFRVLHDLNGAEIDDLTIFKDEILTLVKQQDDDWWLFKNAQTKLEGLVPINHIKPCSETFNQSKSTSLVNVLKSNNDIPSGFIPSSLGPLTQQDQYKLSYTLIPKMTESNLTFADLHWQYDADRINVQAPTYQKILIIQKCAKIPKIKEKNVNVKNRCIRICLYDGFKIISNIHSSRVNVSKKLNTNDLTEDWKVADCNEETFIDEESRFLIRSNEYDPSKSLHLLIELSLLCESKTNKQTCEIGCGWIMVPLSDDHNHPLDTSITTKYNKHLHGGHFQETNMLLDSQYKNLHSHGLSGQLDRYKQARIRFSIESREKHSNTFYNQLPLTSMIIPINLISILVFYRNELAYQLQKRSSSSTISTIPLQSIFLSTFYQALEQPELIFILQILYHREKKLTDQEQQQEFIKIYELSVYPLLFYRSLPTYDFHSIQTINLRRQLIQEMLNKQLQKNVNQPDILALLLDPILTDKWTPFTTDEICFSLQKYVHLTRSFK
ncbi:hypothetical protein I4U23_028870 [Adineta vaga]|nr:hypothetical protein I4U23_028870 [Adineta vaga]